MAHRLRRVELVEHHIDPPAVGVAVSGRQRLEHRLIQRQRHAGRWHVLLDITHLQAPRAYDVARGQFPLPHDSLEQRGLAAAIASHEADAVTIGDNEIQV